MTDLGIKKGINSHRLLSNEVVSFIVLLRRSDFQNLQFSFKICKT